MPLAICFASPSRSKVGNISCASCAPVTRVQRLVQVDQALVDELGGDDERGRRGALADPGLQHPELAALDGELDVAQVPVVALERGHDLASARRTPACRAAPGRPAAAVLRMPATTSSPCAFGR